MNPVSFLGPRLPPSPPAARSARPTISTGSTSVDGRRHARQRETQFILKHGHRHHSYDSEKAPYPLSYDKHVMEMEALDNRLLQHLRGSSSFVDFDEHPSKVLDLGCGTGAWVLEAAREWPNCEFIGFDLVNVQFSTKYLDPSVATRVQWKHGNFLTTKLPFEDDEFDHVHVSSIARGVPENKWNNIFEEINRVLRPGGSVEVMEDDIIFPVLPRWFTSALRAKPRPSTSPGSTTATPSSQGSTYAPSSTSTIVNIPSHDHALLESLSRSVFEHRFINLTPTALLPNYFTTFFRQVTISPVVTFPMPLLAPLLPLPPQIVTNYVVEPHSDTLTKRISTISPARPMSHSFSSSSTTSTTSTTLSKSASVFSKRPRTASASLASPWSASTSSIAESVPSSDNAQPIFKPFMLDTSPNDDDSCPFPTSLFSLDRLREMSERSLAMHLYRSYQTVLACQEAMWEELQDRIRNRKEELAPYGWEDDDELGELKNRKRFEKLIERFKRDMHIRMSLWTSLTSLGWELPSREPLSKAELIEEERIRESMMRASKYVTLDDVQTPCRSPVKPKKSAMSNKGKGKENLQNVPSFAWDEQNAWADEAQETAWEWKYLNDFSSSKVPPLFSKDGSYFFCLAGVCIKIFSVATGLVVSELILPSGGTSGAQASRFTSAVINPHNFFQLITGTLDGRLLIWDFLNAALLREIDVGQPIHFLCVHENFKDSVVAAASLVNKRTAGDNDAVVLRISLKTTSAGKPTEVRAIGKVRSPSGLAYSVNGSWIVASAGHTVYVAKSSALEAGFVKYVSPERLTCLAMHPSEDYFATGDDKGNVRIWYCLNSNAAGSRGVEKRSQTTTLHWHAHAVSALSFTPNGAYLLSGGEEAVLVIWQIHSGKKEFVPRVGAPISTISICQSPSGEEYLLGLNDGAFSFVSSSTLRITRSFAQIKIDSEIENQASSSKPTSPPLAYHRLSSSLILPSSHPQSLQIYSPSTSTLLSELEVSPSNRVSRRDDKPLEVSHVDHVALSSCGLWMATLDARNGELGYPPEIFLKIWAWCETASEWSLHSRIDQPHGNNHVSNIAFSPQSGQNPLYLSSCCEGGTLKIWRLTWKNKNAVWSPHASLTFPSSSLRSITWSADGTIFALSFESRIVLYDSSSVSSLNTISSSVIKDVVSSYFIGSGHLLISTKKGLVLWDLILQSVSWHHASNANIAFVVPHSEADSFAVFYQDEASDGPATTVHVFDVTSSQPRMTQSVPLRLRTAVWFGLADGTRAFNLVALTQGSKVVVLGDDPSISQAKPSSLSLGFASQKTSIFQDVFGSPLDLAGPSTLPEPSAQQPVKANSKNGDAFPFPAYLAPSLSSLSSPILKDFLHARESGPSGQKEKDKAEDSDEEMEDDFTGVSPESRPSVTQLAFSIDHMAQFFKSHSISSRPALSKTNGVHVANLTNGVHPQPNAGQKESGRTSKKMSL